MPLICRVRPLLAGVLAAVFASTAGCPRSVETPKKPPNASASKRVAANEATTATKLPAAEFQQPPVLPTTELLPRPGHDLAETSLTQTPDAASDSTPEPRNPLRPPQQAPYESPAKKPPEMQNPPPAENAAPQTSKEESPPPGGRPRTAKNSGVPFDPIKENGPIFVDWPRPTVALVITGMEEGYLEPCGCAGMDHMKGGMSRRHTLFRELREKGWSVVGLDVGGLVQGFGRQVELKFHTAVEGKLKMGYNAIAFGVNDLRLPTAEVVSVAASADGAPSPFISANVGLFGFAAEITPKSRIIDAGGMKIAVTAILGNEYQRELHNDEIELSDPEAALEQLVPELKRQADCLVLLAHATLDESVALAKKFPAFHVVVTAGGPPEPPAEPQTIEGTKTLLITVGHKGTNAIVLGLFDDADPPLLYQRVPLDSRFAPSPDMKTLMAAYQENLKILGFAELGLRPPPHPLAEMNGRFIGSKKCESCHEESYKIWKKSGHGRAYDTLVKLDPPRNFDPECVSCHVTGWHPTSFFPYQTGYESREKTPHLIDTGCEACHGPGEKHATAELGGNEALQAELRKAVVITKAESKKQQCASCHDLDNSPDFDFDAYWPFVEHYETEE